MKVIETLAKLPKAETPEEIIYNEYINKLHEEIAVNSVFFSKAKMMIEKKRKKLKNILKNMIRRFSWK